MEQHLCYRANLFFFFRGEGLKAITQKHSSKLNRSFLTQRDESEKCKTRMPTEKHAGKMAQNPQNVKSDIFSPFLLFLLFPPPLFLPLKAKPLCTQAFCSSHCCCSAHALRPENFPEISSLSQHRKGTSRAEVFWDRLGFKMQQKCLIQANGVHSQ